MLLAIVDTETTGVDFEQSQLIEVGCVVFDTGSMSEIMQLSSVVPTTTYNDAAFFNRISNDLLKTTKEQLSSQAEKFLKMVAYLANMCDYVVAHNAEFDKKFLSKYVEIRTPWLCTQNDFEFERGNGGSLLNLANELGVPIVNNHRALADCRLITNILKRYDSKELEEMISYAAEDSSEVVALVSYAQKDQAKQHGFRFNPERKQWLKKVKTIKLVSFCASLPFEVLVNNL